MYAIKATPEDFIVDEIPLFEAGREGEYSYYFLDKRDYDTEKAIQRLSETFKIPRRYFSYAGNKDRFAVTTQLFSVRGKIKETGFTEFRTRFYGKGPSPISLGDLKGNRFTITVRNITEKPAPISKTINYFDEQRFGKSNLEVGLALLKKDYKSAASLIDFQECAEHLRQNPTDLIGSIRRVPFKILSMYLHAVQSYLWNEVAAEYIRSEYKITSQVKYSRGVFSFTKAVPKEMEIPLVSFDVGYSDEKIKRLYEVNLKRFGLSIRDFIIRPIPDLTPKGAVRNLVSHITNLDIGELEPDELNKDMKKVKIKFDLEKGCYATIALKDLLSN